jgi:hypothetical protein
MELEGKGPIGKMEKRYLSREGSFGKSPYLRTTLGQNLEEVSFQGIDFKKGSPSPS